MIGLIDYGSGNLRSVEKALTAVGAAVRMVSGPEGLDGVNAVVLPGVGAFGDCAKNLRLRGLWEPMQQWVGAAKPFLGICVGYQLLFDASEESPGVPGLGCFRGTVRRFLAPGLKVPHMGWNTLSLRSSPLWRGLPENPFVFYVHSYFPVPEDTALISAVSGYGESFAAAISAGAVHAVQFHPEKSQANGLAILRNFVEPL